MDIRTDGALSLLDKLSSIKGGEKLKTDDLEGILSHPDIQLWLKAYDWIEDQEEKFKEILKDLPVDALENIDQEGRNIEDLWMDKITYGLMKAVKEPEEMRSSVEKIKNFGWESTTQKALKYLPEDTELEPVMIVTIDGFNGGMFRHDTVYLSLVYFDPLNISEDTFAHELHHMGTDYWWKKDPRIQRPESKEDKQEYYLTQLFTYLVGEGMANAFCSPEAITRLEGAERHNKMVQEYQEKIDGIFDKLEELLERIVDRPENVPELFSGFTMDKENKGIPPGHFLSGKMIQMMDRSYSVSREEIISLVEDPFDFLRKYNKAAEGSNARKFSKEIVKKVEDFLERAEMKEKL